MKDSKEITSKKEAQKWLNGFSYPNNFKAEILPNRKDGRLQLKCTLDVCNMYKDANKKVVTHIHDLPYSINLDSMLMALEFELKSLNEFVFYDLFKFGDMLIYPQVGVHILK